MGPRFSIVQGFQLFVWSKDDGDSFNLLLDMGTEVQADWPYEKMRHHIHTFARTYSFIIREWNIFMARAVLRPKQPLRHCRCCGSILRSSFVVELGVYVVSLAFDLADVVVWSWRLCGSILTSLRFELAHVAASFQFSLAAVGMIMQFDLADIVLKHVSE
jgi:hypothetical protein